MGLMIWMPALEISTSTPPNCSTTLAVAASTAASSVTFISTAIALPPLCVDLVGGGLRRGQRQVGDHDLGAFLGVLERDFLADAAGRAGDDGDLVLELHVRSPVECGSQRADSRGRRCRAAGMRSAMMCTVDRISSTGRSAIGASAWWRRSRPPGPVQAPLTVTSVSAYLHQLADARRAVHVRDDLQQEGRRLERGLGHVVVHVLVLEAHGAGGDAELAVVERAHQRVGVHAQVGLAQLLREAPQLAAGGDRRVVVEEHRQHEAAVLAVAA